MGLRIFFCENSPGIFHFFTLPLEIPDKTKLNPWMFHKIVLDPLEISRPKTKIHGNSTLFFLGHPSKLHFVFNSTCYFSDTPGNSISSKPTCLDFFLGKPNCFLSYIWLFFIIDQQLLLTRYNIL